MHAGAARSPPPPPPACRLPPRPSSPLLPRTPALVLVVNACAEPAQQEEPKKHLTKHAKKRARDERERQIHEAEERRVQVRGVLGRQPTGTASCMVHSYLCAHAHTTPRRRLPACACACAQGDAAPGSAAEFEALVLSAPNSSYLWVQVRRVCVCVCERFCWRNCASYCCFLCRLQRFIAAGPVFPPHRYKCIRLTDCTVPHRTAPHLHLHAAVPRLPHLAGRPGQGAGPG